MVSQRKLPHSPSAQSVAPTAPARHPGDARWSFILGPLAGLVIALGVLAITPPTYTARGALFVDPRLGHASKDEPGPANSETDALLIESQVSFLTSDKVLRRVVETEKLADDPDYGGVQASSPLAKINALLRGPRHIVDAETLALENFARTVRAKRVTKSSVLEVEVDQASPEKAARLANAVMQTYIDDEASATTERTLRAGALIIARHDDLQAKVRLAETRLEDVRKANRIEVSDGDIISEQKLGQLNTELNAARTIAAQAAARLEKARAAIEAGTPEVLPEALQSSLVQKLREQYSQVARREAALALQLKSRHPMLVEVRSELNELAGQINEELNRIAASTAAEASSAKAEAVTALAREREILTAIEAAKSEIARSISAQTKLRVLEQDLATARDQMDDFNIRAKQIREQAELALPTVRIITPAAVPTRQSFPSPLLFLAVGTLAGLGLSIARARCNDAASGGGDPAPEFVAPPKLPVRANLPVLAKQPGTTQRSEAWFIGSSPSAAGFTDILDAMTAPADTIASNYKQAIERLANTMRGKTANSATPVVAAVVSPHRGAGATSTALALAYAISRCGDRTLLVDASSGGDLSDLVAPQLDTRTPVVLDNKGDLARITVMDERLSLAVLPIALADLSRLKATQRRRLADGLATLAENYDTVIIDGGALLDNEGAAIILSRTDEILVVTGAEKSSQADIDSTARIIEGAAPHAKHGVILIGIA